VAVVPSPWSKDRQLLHIGVQGYAAPRADQPPLNLVFLIDTSGSMSGPDRLPLAQKALNVLIDQLRPQDRVAMVAYAGSAGAVLSPTDGRSKLKMRCALTALHSGGSTAGGQGLKLAYDLAKQNFDSKAVNRVILVTDGDFNVGVAEPARLKDFVADQRKSGVYLSVYGFGRGNYNDTMMQALAQNGNGTAAYVDSLQEARKLLRDDFDSALFPSPTT
jgi:Ca-activated chloride channel family protein